MWTPFWEHFGDLGPPFWGSVGIVKNVVSCTRNTLREVRGRYNSTPFRQLFRIPIPEGYFCVFFCDFRVPAGVPGPPFALTFPLIYFIIFLVILGSPRGGGISE
jgi:hypothetical protein